MLPVSATSDINTAVGLIQPRLDRCPSHYRDAAGRLVGVASSSIGAGTTPYVSPKATWSWCVHFSGGPWDDAALVVIVEEAGGCFSDLVGGRRLDTHTALFTNGALHSSSA